MSDLSTQLWEWFQDRPAWLQEATRRLLQIGTLKKEDIEEMVILCKREAGITVEGYEGTKAQSIPEALFGDGDKKVTLRLDAISEITGINALAPRKPLEFKAEPLNVIFGNNGSGKSGYTRILKHACGARGAGVLYGNVFKKGTVEKSCKFTFTLDNVRREVKWFANAGANHSLRTICLYDSDAAHVYVNDENEVAYEPSLLACFRLLVDTCEAVDRALQNEIEAKPQAKPTLPAEFQASASGVWFNGLTAATSEAAILENCKWTTDDDTEWMNLTGRLGEANPSDKAKTLRKTKAHVTSFKTDLSNRAGLVSDFAFSAFVLARNTAISKRRAARVDVEKVFANAPLDGIGSESWRLLWDQARSYSESLAYPNSAFPNVGDQSVCVLCQQPLSEEARDRFKDFESFVKGNLESEAETAEKDLKAVIDTLEKSLSATEIETRLDLCGITEEVSRTQIKEHCKMLENRRKSFVTATAASDLNLLSDESVRVLAELEATLETKASAFEEDAQSNTRPQLEINLRELNSRKWVFQQIKAVKDEVARLNEIKLLRDAIKLTNTKALSDKKSALAEELITKVFVRRFEEELALLGASRICVTITKTKTTKGHVWHQIKLKDCETNVRTSEVLSEGEFRIVSLAAFLADVDVSGFASPFVFDDPISSLDQDFEEAAALRLVKLCDARQVIVFTHRLSLLAMLEDAAEKAGVAIRVIALQKESWGSGEPGGPPLPAQKPKAALNALMNERLQKARKVWENDGSAMYSVEARALCSDVRITIERLIELELLADVVQRFRRPINTMGKIAKLARINIEDCALMDNLMTKYSRYEHAQPREAPVTPPEPDEIGEDLKKLKAWYDEFTCRPTVALGSQAVN
jgi:energy-coupling factor transporter ATP-binding protein EcfA2